MPSRSFRAQAEGTPVQARVRFRQLLKLFEEAIALESSNDSFPCGMIGCLRIVGDARSVQTLVNTRGNPTGHSTHPLDRLFQKIRKRVLVVRIDFKHVDLSNYLCVGMNVRHFHLLGQKDRVGLFVLFNHLVEVWRSPWAVSTTWLKIPLACFILEASTHGAVRENAMTLSQASLQTKDRGKEIARAAYSAIAEKGFEGLRMREIAARAGLNHSTLHYYYAGKEALIAGVMTYMIQELSLGRNHAAPSHPLSPREELAAHLAALLDQAREHPEMFVVLAEIHGRSTRDPGIRSVMSRNERAWKKFIADILRAGIRCGDFARGLDADIAAEAVVSLIRGLDFGHSRSSLRRAERALDLLMRWLEGTRET